jgi:hypothetical protein
MQPGQGQRQASASTFTTSNSDEPIERRKANHSRRSSSPFEVKLSATVSKRVSLDAFGGGLETAEAFGQEEVLEDIESESDHYEESEQDVSDHGLYSSSQYSQAAVDLTEYHATTLSTIEEVSSRDLVNPAMIPGNVVQNTRYNTPPGTPAKEYVSRDSPFLPPRKHHSEPPLRQAQVLIEAHEHHTKTLTDQLQASERVATSLQSETRTLRDALEEESDEKRKAFLDVGLVQRELLQLEELCRDKDLGE